jgi:hypothetical protein
MEKVRILYERTTNAGEKQAAAIAYQNLQKKLDGFLKYQSPSPRPYTFKELKRVI